MVDEMIDLGKEAHPTFVDYNLDGLMDLVVGNNSFFRPFGEKAPRIYLFENIGSATDPAFELVDDDYLNFSVYDNTPNFSPSLDFGDLDNDGDLDVLIGEESGGFFFGENIAGPGNTINIPSLQFPYQDLDLGVRSVPQIIDLNRDGKLDIVAGEKVGRLVYFQNDGTPEEPIFTPNISSTEAGGNNIITLGLVDTRLGGTSGYASPCFYDFGDEYALFTGSEKGNILKYSNIEDNLNGDYTLDTDFFGELRPGFLTVPNVIDIDNDGILEMFVGNVRGGITAYKTNIMTDGSPVSNHEVTVEKEVKIYPNPANDFVNIEIINEDPTDSKINVYNAIGQIVYRGYLENINTVISTRGWGKGLFVIQIEIGQETLVKKLIVN